MNTQALADAMAHTLAAKAISEGVPLIPAQAVAELAGRGYRIRVIFEAFTPEPLITRRHVHLKAIHSCLLEAAPRHDAEPITIKKLAKLAGYAYTSHMREAAAYLIDAGLLIRFSGGVRKAKP